MTDEAKKLVEDLREYSDWAHANEWETPITLGADLDAAADMIVRLSEALEWAKQERYMNILKGKSGISELCVYCKHDNLCNDSFILCETCKRECTCRTCYEYSHFELCDEQREEL